MRITLTGTSTTAGGDEVELTIEYVGGSDWQLKVGKAEFVVSDLEKSMKFLLDDFKSNDPEAKT